MPHFFLIEGGLGHGKTLTASILAHSWRIRSGGQARIFANYDLRNATKFDSVERWVDVAEARGSFCIWDEAQTQFDRRLWTRNTFLTQIFNMTRKIRAVHLFLNPVGSNLDGRILDLVEIFCHVTKRPGRGIVLDFYEYQDKRFGAWGRPLNRVTIPWWKVQQIFRLQLYDTDQMLYRFQAPKTERDEIKMLQRIIEAQERAAALERREARHEKAHGWINPSDHYEARRILASAEAELSGEIGISLPEHPSDSLGAEVYDLALLRAGEHGGPSPAGGKRLWTPGQSVDIQDEDE